jgi:hypothetical protein
MDERMLKLGGDAKRKELITQFEEMSLSDGRGKMTVDDENIAKYGDKRQAEGLLE